MKRLLASLVLAAWSATAALAMQQASVPSKFPIPWGNSAGSAYIRSIPVPSQIGVTNCAASLTDGFPPLTFVPASAGGCPPFGADFNGVLKQLSQWSQWNQAGGPVFFDSAFAASIGGYPKGAFLMSSVVPGHLWMSIADDNATNPDASGANWVQAPGQIPTGTPVQSLFPTVPYGYVAANGTTIGDALSNAGGRANDDTKFLFSLLWSGCNVSLCPIFTSTGAGSTRGASAAADFAAHKAIATLNMKGTGLIGVDTMGATSSTFLAGVPVAAGSTTVPGSIVGENLHLLTPTETPTITSSNGSQSISVSGTVNVSGGIGVSGTVNVSGGVSVSGTVANGGAFDVIPVSNGAVSSLQAPGTGTVNITPANNSGNWGGVTSLFGTMTGSNSMSGSNTLSGSNSMSGSNTLSAANSISVTSNNTGGATHNNVERSALVYWNLKL